MKTAFCVLIFIHSAIHLVGFAKGLNIAQFKGLTKPISKRSAYIWLLANDLLVLTAVFCLIDFDWWWMLGLPTVFISQYVINKAWQDAKFGTIPNIIIIFTIVVALATWNFNRAAQEDVNSLLLNLTHSESVITDSMLAPLPPVVQKWLRRSNIIGKKQISFLQLRQQGEMRTEPKGKWMKFSAEQSFDAIEPAFVWTADVSLFPGVFIVGKDKFKAGHCEMNIKALSIFSIVNASGKEFDEGTMIRYLAEIAWFPSAALSRYITWEPIDSTSAKATMNYCGTKGVGIFKFNEAGDISSFTAQRYYTRDDKTTLETWYVRMLPDGYRSFHGIRIPTKSEITWKLSSGDFMWLRLKITELIYNRRFRSNR